MKTNTEAETTPTASVERMKNLKSIETDAAPAWESQGVLRTTVNAATTTLLRGTSEPKGRTSSLVKKMPRSRTKRSKR